MRSFKRSLAAVGLAAMTAGLAASPAHGEPAPAAAVAPTSAVPWVLTIRGGVSLGAYEAGFNWALVRLLKARALAPQPAGLPRVQLAAVTGASAGSINAVLSALSWCQATAEDEAESITNNLFWDSWIPVGFGALFPEDTQRYAPDDGLFTRAPMRAVEDRLRQVIRGRRFRDGCRLPLGISVTREKPASIRGSGDAASALAAETQRFVVAFDAVTGEGRIGFRQRSRAQEDATLGKTLYLRTDPNRWIAPDDLFTVVEAASAFPVAFGPKAIAHCDDDPSQNNPGCPDGGRVATERFLDGGVFDNQPLGLAVSLVTSGAPQPAPGCARTSDAPFQFLYIDPDARRHWATASSKSQSSPLGLRYLFGVAGNFFDVSSGYELQAMVRYQANRVHNPQTRFRPGTRFGMVVGEHLGHFAAFLAEPFRRYDFGVGVYDAIYTLAERACAESSAVAQARCVASGVHELHDELRLDDTGNPKGIFASRLVRGLLDRELRAWLGKDAAPLLAELRFGSRAAAEWVKDPVTANPDPVVAALLAAHDVIHARRLVGQVDDAFDAEFRVVLGQINASPEARSASWSKEERDLIDDYDGWVQKTMFEAAWRQRTIEVEAQSHDTRRLLDFSTFALLSYAPNPSSGIDLDPSSIPDARFSLGQAIARVVPYYATTDLARGGVELGYRPTLHLGRRFALGTPFAPLSWSLRGDKPGDDGTIGMRLGLAGIAKFDNPVVASVELGPVMSSTYSKFGFGDPSFGMELALVGAMRKVRLSLSANDIVRSRDGAEGYDPIWNSPSFSVRLGFADVNGMFYWLGRMVLPGEPSPRAEQAKR